MGQREGKGKWQEANRRRQPQTSIQPGVMPPPPPHPPNVCLIDLAKGYYPPTLTPCLPLPPPDATKMCPPVAMGDQLPCFGVAP